MSNPKIQLTLTNQGQITTPSALGKFRLELESTLEYLKIRIIQIDKTDPHRSQRYGFRNSLLRGIFPDPVVSNMSDKLRAMTATFVRVQENPLTYETVLDRGHDFAFYFEHRTNTSATKDDEWGIMP